MYSALYFLYRFFILCFFGIEWQIKNQVNCESAVEALALLCRSTWEKNREESRILEFRSDLKIGDFQLEWIYLNTMAVLLMWKRLTEHFIKPVRIIFALFILIEINLYFLF